MNPLRPHLLLAACSLVLLGSTASFAVPADPQEITVSAERRSSCEFRSLTKGCSRDSEVLAIPAVGVVRGRCEADPGKHLVRARLYLDALDGVELVRPLDASQSASRGGTTGSAGNGLFRKAEGPAVNVRGEAFVRSTVSGYVETGVQCRFRVVVGDSVAAN